MRASRATRPTPPTVPAPSPAGGDVTARSRWQPLLTVARVAFDAAVIVLAAVLAFLIRFGAGWFQVEEAPGLAFSTHLAASLLWVIAVLAAMGLNRLYDEDTLFAGGGELPRVLRSIIEGIAVVSVFVYFTQSFSVSRSWFALTALLSAAFLGIQRLLVRRGLARERSEGRFRRPVILVSNGPRQDLEASVAAVTEFHVVAHASPEQVSDTLTIDGLKDADLVVATTDVGDAELWRIVIEAGQTGRVVFLQSPVRAVRRDRLTVREVGGRALVKVSPPYFTGFRALRKRAFDLVVGGILFLILSPVMLAIGLAVLVSSGWPILYGQDRVGKDGRVFTMWKFRTMRRDADKGGGTALSSANDPRRTPIGRFLRRTSLDELPQLWNVLLGHMSLIGPRPLWVAETEHPAFAQRFEQEMSWYAYRHRIRPGITGWAQIHGLRGQTPMDPWVQHDNWYIENWSLALDVKILLKTLAELVRGRNAY